MDKMQTLKKFKNIFYLLFILVITAAFIIFIHRNAKEIKEALKIRPSFLLYIILLNLANKVFVGLKTRKVIGGFGVRLKIKEWLGASIITNFYNYLAPKSGTALTAVYFKNKHGINYKKYLSVLIITTVITILTCGIAGILASIYAYSTALINNTAFFVIFAGMILGSGVLLCMPSMRLPDKGVFDKINKVLEGWHILRKNIKMVFFLAFLDIGIIFVIALRYYIIFKMLSINTSLVNCMLLSPFNIIFHFATFIPGGYGVKEAVVGLMAKLTNIGFATGVLATLGDRVIVMLFAFITGPIFSLLLFKHIFLPKEEIKANE